MSSSNVYNFARGHPNHGLVPVTEMQSLMTALASPDRSDKLAKSLGYGDEAGDKDFLSELSSFLERNTKHDDLGEDSIEKGESRVTSAYRRPNNELFITNGVSHGLDLLCSTQTQPGDVVLMERPSYFLVSGIIKSHGLVRKSLPMNNSGIDVTRLIELVEQGQMDAPRMIYIIPTYQNPTGRTMQVRDRQKLAAFAIENNILLVADEVYHLLDWRDVLKDGPRPARMASFNRITNESASKDVAGHLGCCVSVSSFTKIFSPGIRCGWIEGPPTIIESLKKHGYIVSQGGCAPFVGEVMRYALSSGVADKVLQHLKDSYRDRAQALCHILAREERILIVQKPLGGYFLWLRFPSTVKSEDFLQFCKTKVKFMPGTRCDPLGNAEGRSDSTLNSSLSFESYARLCFADLDKDAMEEGANQLMSCFQDYIQTLTDNEMN